MKNIKILLVLAGVVFSMMSSCKTPETISGYYSYETQCLGNLGDGTQLVKSWGTGLDRKPIPGEESQSWGTIGWLRNNLFGLMAESSLDHELAEGILGEDYLRVNSELKDINPQLDDNSKENIEKIIEMGHSWWKIYGEKSLNLING